MNGSILTVHVVEARELRANNVEGLLDPFVELTIEDQVSKTNYKKGTLDPVWNESSTFDIVHGQDPLKLEVLDQDTFAKDTTVGIAYLDLQEIAD